jgi:hypothetical protein
VREREKKNLEPSLHSEQAGDEYEPSIALFVPTLGPRAGGRHQGRGRGEQAPTRGPDRTGYAAHTTGPYPLPQFIRAKRRNLSAARGGSFALLRYRPLRRVAFKYCRKRLSRMMMP